MISITASSRYKINRKLVKKKATEILLEQGFGPDHLVTIIFAGRSKLKEIAKTYKKEDEALPVLTFVYNEESDGKKYLGEIFICYPHAVLLAAQKNKRVDETIIKLVTHGLDNIFKHI